MTGSQAVVFVLSTLLAGGRWLALKNFGALMHASAEPETTKSPGVSLPRTARVSICVPARDEERVIGRLLESLCAQTWPDLEILVVDDHSTDRTAAILDDWAARDPRIVRVIPPPLPVGWLGKNHALHIASERASGDLLLFVDADTLHHPRAVEAAVTAIEGSGGADVLVVLSGQEVGSWAEKVVSPFFWGLILPAVNLAAAEDPTRPNEAMGNGQFAMYRASAYRAAGGHAAVRDVVVEDVSLVRRMKQAGMRYRLVIGSGLTRTRMYRSFIEVWHGFSKNVAIVRPGHRLGDSAMTGAVITLVGLAELGPWIALTAGSWCWIPGLLHLAALIWLRSAILRRMCCSPGDSWPGQPVSHPLGWALLQPLGAMLGLAIFCNALRLQWTRGGRWKGRVLTASRPI
ncbi:MAG: glycosyltransferase [Myxococcales bacterium]|nr:glycosyltransferase [Myxococcales bacterium]